MAIDDEPTIERLQATIDALAADRAASRQRRIETIGELRVIVSSIHAIADTMKRLSINATIESARVGDVGRGFSIVAVEMKSLAEAAKTAVGRATALLDARGRDQNAE